ncbi:MAG: Lipopolysaccharide core heptosyltransferase RfaQ [Chlamydiae bacterium]|nr:Lipopolysaccharide core heptosyltransferase RfaQ [Chlamydiota bacterium]
MLTIMIPLTEINNPDKILLCNGAHLGDLIISTAVLPILKKAFPDTKIGFLVGSWALPVVQNHTMIDWIHCFDHPHINRRPISQSEKKKQGHESWIQAIKEVREKEYDLAIDLYYFYQANSGSLLTETEIPIRCCYWGSPSHFHFTHRLFWDFLNLHMVENHRMMMEKIGITKSALPSLKMTLDYKDTVSLSVKLPEQPYIVVHPGVGDWRRQWKTSYWKRLLHQLQQLDHPLIFLGRGKKERVFLAEITRELSSPIILCDQLSWRELIPLIEKARCLVGLESMCGHLAAALNTPAVLIYGRPEPILYWRPYSPSCHVITTDSPPFPDKPLSYDEINTIKPEKVFKKVHSIIDKPFALP